MGTFFKTFFVCLVITFGFLTYKFVQNVGYEPELEVSKNHPVFGIHEEVEQPFFEENKKPQEDKKPQEQQTITEKSYLHVCYFYSASGQLVSTKRELKTKPSIENAITLLLKGPTIQESQKGIYTEIPPDTDLISVKRKDNSVIINLTSNFGNGGGTKSVENRVKQLASTVKAIENKKDIYLYINDKEVEYLGGDGVYIKQPLE